jgi:hypothetical protein
MAEVLFGVVGLLVGLLYLCAPFVAIAAWRHARRLETDLRTLERRLAMRRFEPAAEPVPLQRSTIPPADARPPSGSPAEPIVAPGAALDLPRPPSGPPPLMYPPAEPLEPAPRDRARPEPPPLPSLPAVPSPRAEVDVAERLSDALQGGWRAVASTWEERIGGSVLSKAGALLVVIGVALFVGWSMMNLGPGGRVAIALAVSGTLLAGGLGLQRWADYRSLALGLSAAGWGGLYVTVYAMHGLAAARIIDDPRLALGLLLAVAAGMIVHALWLEVPTLVAVAYAAAFAAVVIGPPSAFAAVACVVLAGTLLIVAARRAWSGFAVAGVLCTYGILAVRFPEPDDASALLPALSTGMAILWACWSMFEVYDVAMAARGRGGVGRAIAPLNLCGLLGVALLHWPPPFVGLDWFLAAAAAAYAVSTIVRLSVGGRPGRDGAAATIAGPELAVTIAAALWAAALWMRFSAGWRLHVGLLMEAEILFLLGIALGWRHLRALAAIVFAVLLVRFVACDVLPGGEVIVGGITLARWTPAALVAAAALVVNRAILAWRGRPLLAGESLATFAATALVTLVIGGEAWQRHLGLSLATVGFAWLVLAWLLMELAVRWRFVEAYVQACIVAFLALVPLALVNAFPDALVTVGGDAVPAWAWLGPAVGMLHAIGWRLAGPRRFAGLEPAEPDVSQAILVAATSGALLLAWHALPAPLVALAWAGYAVVAFGLGVALPHAGLRWHAYAVLALTVGRLFLANFTNVGMTGMLSHRLLTVGPVVLVLYGLAIRLADSRLRPPVTGGERLLGPIWSWIGTIVLLVLMRFELGRVLTVGGWAAVGVVLLVLGQRLGSATLRWQSHAIALATFARSWGTGFAAPEGPDGLLNPVRLGGFVVTCLFASELLCPSADRGPHSPRSPGELLAWLDAHRRTFYAILGTALLAILLVHEVPTGLLTAALGIEGAALLVVGFARPDRGLRACGLAVLGVCVAKLFFHDLRHLETPYRILSFILLGILLLAASWVYTRFKPRLRGLP